MSDSVARLSLTKVDPAWAWSPFAASETAPWNRAAAAHLHRRAGFAASFAELDRTLKLAPVEAVDRLLAGGESSGEFNQQMDDMAASTTSNNQPESLAPSWLFRMVRTPFPLLEKLTLFWHGHFACGADKVTETRMMLDQNNLLRRGALGPFGQLTQDIARDAAMLVYLDSATNRKAHPNENFARELMELFCLGVGNYTERDVQELARCFTGWEVSRNMFRFNDQQHDFGSKTILGKSGVFDGGDAIKIVVKQPAAARFIAAKLVRFFVTDDPDVPDSLIEPLAVILRENDFVISHAVRRLLHSQLFFSPYAVGRKIRSPVELAVGLLRALDGGTNFQTLAAALRETNQSLFFPPSVKGWDGGRTWINSSTLVSRANLVRHVIRDAQSKFGGGTLAGWADRHQLQQPEKFVDALAELLLAAPLPSEVRAQLIALAAAPGDRNRQLGELLHAMSTLPEFQLN